MLISAPREQLSREQLEQYAFKAVSTIGTISDLRYFWPRLAQLAIANEFWIDAEVVLGKPVFAQHHTWPDIEQRAVLDLADALGRRLAAEELEPDEVDASVCGVGLLAEGIGDVRLLLAPLMSESAAAWTNLCGFAEWNAKDMEKKHRFANGFWENAPLNAKILLEWLQPHPNFLRAKRALAELSAERYGTVPPAF